MGTYEAGVWEQERGLVVWSRHRTQQAAVAAAWRYARQLARTGASAGGALSWSGGWRPIDGEAQWVSTRAGST